MKNTFTTYGYTEARTKGGKLVLMGGRRRVAHTNRAWGYYDAVSVVWIDDEGRELSRESISLGKFNKTHKPTMTGNRRVFDAGSRRYV